MMHETNTFSPLPTPIDSFSRAGALGGPAAIKEAEGTNTSLGGFIEVARKAGAEFTLPMAASAHPSGLVTKTAYEEMTTAKASCSIASARSRPTCRLPWRSISTPR